MRTNLKKGVFELPKVQRAAFYQGVVYGNELYVKFPKKAKRKIVSRRKYNEVHTS